jgi:biopolymer transport protein ExbD
MQVTRRLLIATLGSASALLLACTKKSVLLVSLKVLASGTYEVNGKWVARDALESTLAALKPRDQVFGIHFQPDKAAPYESVQYAMAVAQKLDAKVGIVGNEQF